MVKLTPANIPVLVKHQTVAIFKKDRFGPRRERFRRAFAISRRNLVLHGYLAPGSDSDALDKIALTEAGRHREREHGKERGRVGKERLFDTLFLESYPVKP